LSRIRLSKLEYILLITVLISAVAFSTDAMLPAFPRIAEDLNLGSINQAGLVISVFFLGTGVGQLVMGPLSDSIGRKKVLLGGLGLFMLASYAGYLSQSLETLLIARFVQGLGVSAPRTVTMAMTRDLYQGRLMAQIVSLSTVIFVFIPAIAPFTGQFIIDAWGWRSIFLAFILFTIIVGLWFAIRQGETHPISARRPVSAKAYKTAMIEVMTSRISLTYSVALSISFASVICYLSSAQQIYEVVFERGADFPFWFAVVAIAAGPAGVLNAALVRWFGMRRIVTVTHMVFLAYSLATIAITAFGVVSEDAEFALFLVWSVTLFWLAGLTIGNLTALVLEPMGHIAGMASAISGALSTVIAVVLAIPVGMAFDGSVLPLEIGAALFSAVAIILMVSDPKGRAQSESEVSSV